MAAIGEKPAMNLDAVIIVEVSSGESNNGGKEGGSVVVNKIIDLDGRESQKSSWFGGIDKWGWIDLEYKEIIKNILS